MIHEILLDMDGVLADFVSPCIDRLNAKFGKNITMDQYVKHQTWDIEKVFGITPEEFWSTIEQGEELWINLKPFPWADLLLSLCRSYGRVTICTSPSLSPHCSAQKTEWLLNHFNLRNTELMIGGRKELMARHNNLLIDDSPHNVDKFISLGGKAIQVPSNWNTENLSWPMVKRAVIEGIHNYVCAD